MSRQPDHEQDLTLPWPTPLIAQALSSSEDTLPPYLPFLLFSRSPLSAGSPETTLCPKGQPKMTVLPVSLGTPGLPGSSQIHEHQAAAGAWPSIQNTGMTNKSIFSPKTKDRSCFSLISPEALVVLPLLSQTLPPVATGISFLQPRQLQVLE